MAKVDAPFIDVTQGARKFLVTKLPAGVVANISYVAIRGQNKEEGAIQRILNTRRITNIKDFTIQGGPYPNAIILNWVHKKISLKGLRGACNSMTRQTRRKSSMVSIELRALRPRLKNQQNLESSSCRW